LTFDVHYVFFLIAFIPCSVLHKEEGMHAYNPIYLLKLHVPVITALIDIHAQSDEDGSSTKNVGVGDRKPRANREIL
jgi:hypothetical protein